MNNAMVIDWLFGSKFMIERSGKIVDVVAALRTLADDLEMLHPDFDASIKMTAESSDPFGQVEKQSYDLLELYERKPRRPVYRNWTRLRSRVLKRDKSTCQVCFIPVKDEKGFASSYECGHIVDKMLGGEDALSNLLCMCFRCNQNKPVHRTIEEFDAWRQTGAWWPKFVQRLGRERCELLGWDMDKMLQNEGWNPPPIDYARLGA